ncbi:MAG: Hsp33 family molecular chaperone HslO [Bdellovibrionota bacterium]
MNGSEDVLVRGLLRTIDARFVACRVSSSVGEACRRHSLEGARARLVSEAIAGCVLLGSLLDKGEKFSLQISARGALRSLLADIDENCRVRAAITADGSASYDALAGSEGTLVLSRSKPSGLTYQGICPLRMGHLPSDLAIHCSLSDQVETFLDTWYEPLEQGPLTAGGLLLQALPGADLSAFEKLRRSFEQGHRALAPDLPSDPAAFVSRVLGDFEPRVLVTKPLRFDCTCSADRVSRVLQALGEQEIRSIIAEEHGTEVTCQWCGKRYDFSETDLLALLPSDTVN